jgi:hypothetical protein
MVVTNKKVQNQHWIWLATPPPPHEPIRKHYGNFDCYTRQPVFNLWATDCHLRSNNATAFTCYTFPWWTWMGHYVGDTWQMHTKFQSETPKGKWSLETSRSRWEDAIKINLKGTGCKYVAWIYVVHDTDQWRALVSTVMHFLVPQNGTNFLIGWETLRNWSMTSLHTLTFHKTGTQHAQPINLVTSQHFQCPVCIITAQTNRWTSRQSSLAQRYRAWLTRQSSGLSRVYSAFPREWYNGNRPNVAV